MNIILENIKDFYGDNRPIFALVVYFGLINEDSKQVFRKTLEKLEKHDLLELKEKIAILHSENRKRFYGSILFWKKEDLTTYAKIFLQNIKRNFPSSSNLDLQIRGYSGFYNGEQREIQNLYVNFFYMKSQDFYQESPSRFLLNITLPIIDHKTIYHESLQNFYQNRTLWIVAPLWRMIDVPYLDIKALYKWLYKNKLDYALENIQRERSIDPLAHGNTGTGSRIEFIFKTSKQAFSFAKDFIEKNPHFIKNTNKIPIWEGRQEKDYISIKRTYLAFVRNGEIVFQFAGEH